MMTEVIFLFNNNIPTWADDDTGKKRIVNNNIPTWADVHR